MNGIADPIGSLPSAAASSIQAYARAAGVLLLVSLLAGGFGEFYVPTRLLVAGDAAATAQNIIASPLLFRLSFATYIVEAACDIVLAWVFYVLLRPAGRNLALLAAFFGLVSTATFAIAELFYFAPSFILSGAAYLTTFSPAQIDSLAMISLKYYSAGAGAFMIFYGVACLLRGYMIYQSGYIPRVLGALLALAGLGFVVRNFALILAPAYASEILLAPMFLAAVTLTAWLLVKGVDVQKWEAKAAALA